MTWQKSLRALTKGAPAQYRDLIRAHGTSRKKAVDFICGIGGYSGRHERYAVEFNVKAYGCNFDVDTMYSHPVRGDFGLYEMCKNDGERGLLYNLFRTHLSNAEKGLWESATRDAWESFENDEGTFWGAPLDTKFHLVGRSGGHLVIHECTGVRFDCSEDALRERLLGREDPDAYTGKFGSYVMYDITVMHLFLVCVQITVDWPRKAVDQEVEYHAAWRLWSSLESYDINNLLTVHRDPGRHIVEAAQEAMDALPTGGPDGNNLQACFTTVCEMAGINLREP